ncbi:unnamed protein product [Ostreobium quekettii]|uniref:Conserved oligomeric Golgi complex subunit 8 n=1 Tax=Ostreobium quekettii TaxID=121088 RepID=A0A8S1J4K2_9CHLO|nr:unnamed protein product [Ostreobium quekettii]
MAPPPSPQDPTHLRLPSITSPTGSVHTPFPPSPARSPFPRLTGNTFEAQEPLKRAPSGPAPDFSDLYFSELLSYSLERLNKEPELLQEDRERVKRQVTESAVEHYAAFIEATRSLGTIHDELTTFEGTLEALGASLPKFSGACEGFRVSVRDVMGRRAENQQLLGQQHAVLGLLEVPQLMDACVRNGNYDEALDFQAFMNRLGALHGNMAVVKDLVEEVQGVTNLMLRQLVQKLKSSIQLPECLSVIGYLRRLGLFTERELRLCFLGCREEWIGGLVADLDDGNPYEYLKRVTDVHRLHLFDVVMQYWAVFSTEGADGSKGVGECGLLSSWALHRVVLLLESLKTFLPQVSEGSNVASLLEHCMYCGMSLGRVGLDFRGLLASVFEPCMLDIFSSRLVAAVDSFGSLLESHKWVAMPAMTSGQDQNQGGSDTGEGGKDGRPPHALLEHLPIATFVNGMLAALNELRHCAPVALMQPVAKLMQDSLESVALRLAHYKVTHGLNASQGAVFHSACESLADVAAPYLADCLNRVYDGAGKMMDITSAVEPLKDATVG